MEKIDLHIHTNCSDGSLTPFEVIDKALENRVTTISIADHDAVDAYSKELIEYAKEKGINLIKGVEISTKISKCGIHVLGYNIDINNTEFLNKLSKVRNARHDYLYNVASKLEELGYKVNTEELDKIEAVTKAHIALDIIGNKDNEELLLKEFNTIPSKGLFIETIMNEGCPAYAKKESITPKEAADLIRLAGGKVVLAHPVAYSYEDGLTPDDIKSIISDMNADGVEAYYLYVDRDNNMHNDIDKWLKVAKECNKFVTVGSDFHTIDGIHPEIGLPTLKIEIKSESILKEID